ncbi:hypothetical protein PIB30_106045 [Stylosanthes scabra]|uniref:Uncharacterized protein n=1 Tax=Stylosanthes scabra TaxID=79078 RepID=A0ABU6VYS9_9FABA|nr:hypothetical protein [Stylosanthes scabra]
MDKVFLSESNRRKWWRGVCMVARIVRSFLRADLDFSGALEPVITAISMIGSSSSLQNLGFLDSDFGDRSLSEDLFFAFWVLPFNGLALGRTPFFRDLMVNLRNGGYQWGVIIKFLSRWLRVTPRAVISVVIPVVGCLSLTPGSRMNLGVLCGSYHPINLFSVDELFGDVIARKPSSFFKQKSDSGK